MTNQYMTKLYHDLLSNSPQTVTIDIPADMGTGQISQGCYQSKEHDCIKIMENCNILDMMCRV